MGSLASIIPQAAFTPWPLKAGMVVVPFQIWATVSTGKLPQMIPEGSGPSYPPSFPAKARRSFNLQPSQSWGSIFPGQAPFR